jgi:cytoskeletal protein CcmA (bactofilin family)
MGNVEGEVTGPVIHVTKTGVVAGNVKVKELRSEGELAGSVEADAVRVAGRVRDKTVIRARTLEVSLTATDKGMEVVFGECELAIGDEPNKAAAITAATEPAKDAKEPKEPAPKIAQADPRRRGPSEAAWEEAGAKTAPAEDDGVRRKRGTLPPPA